MVAPPRFYTLTSQDQYGTTHHRGGSDRAVAAARYAAVVTAHIDQVARELEPSPPWQVQLLAYDPASRATSRIGHAGTIGPEARPLAALDFLTGETLYTCTPIGGRA